MEYKTNNGAHRNRRRWGKYLALSALIVVILGVLSRAVIAPIRSQFASVEISSSKKFSRSELNALMATEKRTPLFSSCWTDHVRYDEHYSDDFINLELKNNTEYSYSTLGYMLFHKSVSKDKVAITTISYACLPGQPIDDSTRSNEYSLNADGKTWTFIDGGNG